jgi:RimJ/RimL family protein N-acetyltransferase
MSDAHVPWPPEVTLEGRHVILRPATAEDAPALVEASSDGELWKLWYTFVPPPDGMAKEIERRLAARAQSSAWLTFVVIEKASGQIIGCTSYMNIDPGTPRVEIGGTWYARRTQRSPINTECKFLLLRHAFEQLGCVAVEFRTHALNLQSRAAIERLGAKYDGMIRHHQRTRDGHLRDTVIYSILQAEWPTIATHLTWQMEKPR